MPTFYLLIRGRNCKEFIKKCLKSLKTQTLSSWRALIVLDAPTDGVADVVFPYLTADSSLSGRIDVRMNPKHLGLGRNMWEGMTQLYQNIPESERKTAVMAVLDADDWLRDDALAIVGEAYRQTPSLLVTHGTYIKVSSGRISAVSRAYERGAKVRKADWHASHFKTFRAVLWPHITEDCFRKPGGGWLKAASDLALMFPIIELAGLHRVKFINRRIYFWRDNTVYKTNRDLQQRCAAIVRKKPKFKILADL